MLSNTWNIETHVAGRLPIPGWECFFGRNDCALQEIVFYIVVLRRGDRVGLIDTGLPLDSESRERLDDVGRNMDPDAYFRDVHLLPEILDRANLKPEDIDFVLNTQPITYCTGGMTDELLPNADIYLARDGLEEFLYEEPGHPPREFYFTKESWSFLFSAITSGRLRAVRGEAQVSEDLRFVSTGGHHPGSGAVVIERPDDPIVLIETAFLQKNIDDDIPIGIAESAAIAREAVRSFKRNGYRALAFHDPDLSNLIAGGGRKGQIPSEGRNASDLEP